MLGRICSLGSLGRRVMRAAGVSIDGPQIADLVQLFAPVRANVESKRARPEPKVATPADRRRDCMSGAALFPLLMADRTDFCSGCGNENVRRKCSLHHI